MRKRWFKPILPLKKPITVDIDLVSGVSWTYGILSQLSGRYTDKNLVAVELLLKRFNIKVMPSKDIGKNLVVLELCTTIIPKLVYLEHKAFNQDFCVCS